MDLTARHPRTGELLSTVKFTVQTLAAAGELQRDLQRELTYEGLRAAEAEGDKGGRRPAVTAAKAAAVRAGYLAGRSIAGLARDHGVSRGAIRTAVADLLPDHTAIEADAPVAELPVLLDMPGKVANFLRSGDLRPAERAALDQGVVVRRGQGYTLRVSAVSAVHRQLLARCQRLNGGQGLPSVPAQRKARRECADESGCTPGSVERESNQIHQRPILRMRLPSPPENFRLLPSHFDPDSTPHLHLPLTHPPDLHKWSR